MIIQQIPAADVYWCFLSDENYSNFGRTHCRCRPITSATWVRWYFKYVASSRNAGDSK